jgi:hypothetical protein
VAERKYSALEHPALVLREMGEGASVNEVAGMIGVAISTFMEWQKRYPEFAAAVQVGEVLSEGWWDRVARANLLNPKFNAVLYMMYRNNRHGWRRNDSVEVQHRHSGVVRHSMEKRVDLSRLSTEELLSLQGTLTRALPPATREGEVIREREEKVGVGA